MRQRPLAGGEQLIKEIIAEKVEGSFECTMWEDEYDA